MKTKKNSLCLVLLICGFILIPGLKSAFAQKIAVGVGQEPTTMDPSHVIVGGDFVLIENWAEQFWRRSTNGDLGPGLVDSYKTSSDGKVMELSLRKDVKFHSGDHMTTKDLVFTIERARKKSSTMRNRMKLVEKIEVIDDYTLKLHFKTPDATFIPYGGGPYIVSKAYYDRVGEEKFAMQPVGTGPYKFIRYVPGEYVDVQRFEDYWGEKPQVKEARFYFVAEDTTRVAKLKTGELDLIASVPYANVKDLESNKEIKLVRSRAGHPTPSVVFNTLNPNVPWAKEKVRLAMAHAIDYDAIVKDLLLDIPKRYAYLAPYELAFDPDVKPYVYNPEKAKKLLAEAGYPKGFSFTLNYLMTGRVPMIREIAELISTYFGAIGIKTKLVGQEAGKYYAYRRVEAKKGNKGVYVSLSSVNCVAGGVDPVQFMYILLRTGAGFSQNADPDLDILLDQARATPDDGKREALCQAAVRMINAKAPVIPIFSMVPIYAMKNNIDYKPIRKNPFNIVFLRNITVK